MPKLKPTARWKVETIIGTRIIAAEHCLRESDGALNCHNRVRVPMRPPIYERVPVVIFAHGGWVSVEKVEEGA